MNFYVGYDSREAIAYEICKFSLLKNSSIDIKVHPLIQKNLRDKKLYNRPIDDKGSTEFTFTRFLVPLLEDFKGWAVFCDCDFLWIDDIKNLLENIDNKYAVMVVKHDYKPNTDKKFNNNVQHQYPKKNWSSMILWNCNHPKNKILTTEFLDKQSGMFLHQFLWLNDEDIGSIDIRWNWLVNWYKENEKDKPSALHYTEGGPWHRGYENCLYSLDWKKYKNEYDRLYV
jgi:lipopolysaccharide biosynthesis glycosyltransferase